MSAACPRELARRLRARACLPGTSAAPGVWPGDPDLLDWLRRRTYPGLYTWAAEELLARRWLGGDIFGTRRPPPVPGFLAETDVRAVPPHLVAPLLRRLSLTRPAPDPADLTPHALARDAGRVSRYRRSAGVRRWNPSAPPLPETTEIPLVVHGIWLGRPMPPSSGFWTNYGSAADRYAGEVEFVVWTDIPRHRIHTAPDLVAWASRHGIHLVHVGEVFHAGAPMTLQAPYTIELGQGTPRAFAAASDHLRVEVVHRFGGLYADGDLPLVPRSTVEAGPSAVDGYRLFRGRWDGPADPDGPARLPDLFDRVAASRTGFTLNALTDRIVLNDVVLAPARHPALALWLEGARHNYLRAQRDLFTGERADIGEPASWTWAVTATRSGRVHHWLLRVLSLTGADLVRPAPAVGGYSELSWLPPTGGEPPVPCVDDDPVPTLVACVDLLRWSFLSRSGDLYLTGVAPLVRGLPDPDAAWTALLLAFPDLSADLRAGPDPITSVTDQRRNQDGSVDAVDLPAPARALLPTLDTAAATWFLGERTVPVRAATPVLQDRSA